MTRHVTCTLFSIGFLLLVATPTYPQLTRANAPLQTQTGVSSNRVAYVYVQNSSGINLYDAGSMGKLTLVKGSPFHLSGPGQKIVGSNGNFLVTLGQKDLHSYPLASNGAIEKQASQINTQIYGGSECGAATNSSEFDRTGRNLYVLLSDRNEGSCNAVQTYSLSKSGSFSFLGDTTVATGFNFWIGLPTTTGNGKLGYGAMYTGYDSGDCHPSIIPFRSDNQNVLQYSSAAVEAQFPSVPPGFYNWVVAVPPALASDSTNHIVLAMYATTDLDCRDNPNTTPTKLASFTANNVGALTSTNTYEKMPVIAGMPNILSVSPDNKILAAASGTGIQFFHYNGTNPLTGFTGVIGTSGYITAMQWDSSGHLYAINGATGKLHVYTVKADSVVEAPNSPYSVGAKDLVVAVP